MNKKMIWAGMLALALSHMAVADWSVNTGSSASGNESGTSYSDSSAGDDKAEAVALVPNAMDVLKGLPPKAEFNSFKEQLERNKGTKMTDEEVARLIILTATLGK